MNDDIPAIALNYLNRLIIESRSLAYLVVAKNGYLISCGGNLSTYKISNLQVGKLACKQIIWLEGLLPLDGAAVVLFSTHVEPEICADIHMFSGSENDWILLLDGTAERDRYQLMQQKGNDLNLLRNQQSKIIERYFGQEVKENLAQELLTINERGEQRNLTILSAKICGFTAYSEAKSPEMTFKTLNLYLSPLIQSILDEAGMIDKIIGDTVVSLFGILPSTGCPPKSAIAAAWQMMESIEDLNHRRQKYPLEIAIAITSGSVTLGLVGSKVNKTFCAIGQPVDLMTQLKNQVEPKEILIDENTFIKIDDMQQGFLASTISAPVKTYSCRTK